MSDRKATHDAYIDIPGIVSIYYHIVVVSFMASRLQLGQKNLIMEALQSGSILDLDQYENIGIDISDYAGGIRYGLIFYCFSFEFHPAHPVASSIGHNLRRLFFRNSKEAAPDFFKFEEFVF